MVKLDNTPKLFTNDYEFVHDDLNALRWIKVSTIKYNSDTKHYYTTQVPGVPLDDPTFEIINLALKKLNMPLLLSTSSEEVSKELEIIAEEGATIIEKKQAEKYADYMERVENVIKNYKTLVENSTAEITGELHNKILDTIKTQSIIITQEAHDHVENSTKISYLKCLTDCIQANENFMKFRLSDNLPVNNNTLEVNVAGDLRSLDSDILNS